MSNATRLPEIGGIINSVPLHRPGLHMPPLRPVPFPGEMAQEVIAGRSLKADGQAPRRISFPALAHVDFQRSHWPHQYAAQWTGAVFRRLRSREDWVQNAGSRHTASEGQNTFTGRLSLVPE